MSAEQPGLGMPEVLMVYRNGRTQAEFENLGHAAVAGGFEVEFRRRTDAPPDAAPAEQLPSIYVQETDFIAAARRADRSPATGTKAWNILARDFVAAHIDGREPLVVFDICPSKDEAWGYATHAQLSNLDVHTLQAAVDNMAPLINGKTPTSVTKILKRYLPPGAGIDVFNVWTDVARTLLTPED